jgi:hypothetical protein
MDVADKVPPAHGNFAAAPARLFFRGHSEECGGLRLAMIAINP